MANDDHHGPVPADDANGEGNLVVAEMLPLDDPEIDRESALPHGVPCEACGAPIETGEKFCSACGRPSPQADAGPAPPQEPALRHIRCDNCGAEVAADPDRRSYVCPFCDSAYVVEVSAATGRQPPEFVIGFTITPEQALEAFRAWIARKSFFRPGDLKLATLEGKQRGVYLPFWSFSMLAESQWSANIGEYWYRTETYTTTDSKGKVVTRTRRVRETEWWPLSGRHHRYYSGFLVSGSRGLEQSDAERIKPFQLPALKRYEPFYLAGWMSEEYSVDRDHALQICQHEFYRRENRNVAAFLPGDTHRQLHLRTEFDHVRSDLCLLPVYLLSYEYRGQLYRFLVNGQTGRCAGDKPISWKRVGWTIAAGVVALAGILGLIYWLGNA